MRALEKDTIGAIATASGNGAIGVIRLSGPQARSIAEGLTGKVLQPRYAHLTNFTSSDGVVIEVVLKIFLLNPRHLLSRISFFPV